MTPTTRTFVVVLAAAAFLAVIVPLQLRLGFTADECAGLLDRAPERLYPTSMYPEGSPEPPRDQRGARPSPRVPVWGHISISGTYRPIMLDANRGALSFYPARPFASWLGPTAARVTAAVCGFLLVAVVFGVARAAGGDLVGVGAAVLAAVSSQLAFAYGALRPDEQLHALAHAGAVLAFIRYARNRDPGTFYFGCFLLGFGVACNNAALWSLIAIAVAALAYRLMPRARPHQWLAGLALFAAPLAPQAAYIALAGIGDGVMLSPFDQLGAPWHGLAPDQLGRSIGQLAESLGHMGTAAGGDVIGDPHRAPLVPGVGYALVAVLLSAIALPFSGAASRGTRAFGLGLGVLLLLRLALGYRTDEYFLVLAPWAAIALASAGVALWNAAASPSSRAARWPARAAVLLLAAAVLANSGLEIARYHAAAAAPRTALHDRDAQEEAAALLHRNGIDRPYVTTPGATGVFELLSSGYLVPRYVFPYFHAIAGDESRDAYRRTWRELLTRVADRQAVFVLVPNPSPTDTAPLVRGHYIATELRPAAAALDLEVVSLGHWDAAGVPILEVVSVTPKTPTPRLPAPP